MNSVAMVQQLTGRNLETDDERGDNVDHSGGETNGSGSNTGANGEENTLRHVGVELLDDD